MAGASYTSPSAQNLKALTERVYDVIVIGGGLAGASVARDCAMRRLSVLVIEKDEVGSGWTDISTGLLLPDLGLLRHNRDYLHELCAEVGVLTRIAPNLMEQVPVLFPVGRDLKLAERMQLSALASAYDRFRSWKGTQVHTALAHHQLPLLDAGLSRKLHSMIAWDEWMLDPGRLCARVLKSAESCGTVILKGIAEKIQVHNRRVAGVWIKTGNANRLVRSRVVINAAGPEVRRFYPAQSSLHQGKFRAGLTFFWERRLGTYALAPGAMRTGEKVTSKEVFLPVGLHHAYGPMKFDLPTAEVPASLPQQALGRVLEKLTAFYPVLGQHRIVDYRVAVYWKPQVDVEPGFFDHASDKVDGLFSVLPHSVLEARLVAERVTNRTCGFLRHREVCRTHLEMLAGCVSELSPSEIAQGGSSVDTLTLTRLIRHYGHHTHDIVDQMQKHPELAALVCECEQITAAELVHSQKNEWAENTRALCLRTGMGRGNCQGARCMPWASLLLAKQTEAAPSPATAVQAIQLPGREYADLMNGFGESS